MTVRMLLACVRAPSSESHNHNHNNNNNNNNGLCFAAPPTHVLKNESLRK